MSKALEALKESIITLVQDYGTYGSNREEIYNSLVLKEERKFINILENALDQKAKQDEVMELLFKWFEPQIISEIGKLPRLQIKCGTFAFSYEFENEHDWRLVKDMIAQHKKTK